ncbi:MAG: acetyl-CoA carboxylase biotin carboxyl carrier protein subunit [Planctomycetota bacterium]|nr:MAG: acetyl-CoA carboxylase biotin carboxyl carrier protein subunit [Planctomycetota bacterium]
MKYHVLVNGNHYEVEITRHGGGVRARHADHDHQVDVATLDDGDAYSLLIDGRSVDVGVEERGDRVELLVSGRRYSSEVLGEREWLARSIQAASGEGETVVRAVMTGIVRDVLVAPGDEVQPGQVVLILEAMKMENEVKADAGGTVSALHCATGDTVELDQLLVEFD